MVRLAGGSLAISMFYILLTIVTASGYGTVPVTLWESFGWAVVYLHLLLSFMALLSAVLNRVATTIVVGLIIVFYSTDALMHSPLSGVASLEPFYLLGYFGEIVVEWMSMPDPRFFQAILPNGSIVYGVWFTPTAEGTALFVALYSAIFLVLAFLLYRQRQVKT